MSDPIQCYAERLSGRSRRTARHQRPTSCAQHRSGRRPAVELRSTVSPSRYVGRRQRRELLRGDPALGTDDEHDSSPAPVAAVSALSGVGRALVQDHGTARRRQQSGDLGGRRRIGDHRPPARRACLAASRAVEPPRSQRRSRALPSQRTTHRGADQGTISSTPTSVIISTASSPRSPLASAWTTTIRGVGAGCTTRSRTVELERLSGRRSAPRSAPRSRAVGHVDQFADGSRRTSAACRPSSPASATVGPSGSGSREERERSAERVPQPGEQALPVGGRGVSPRGSPRRAARRARAAAAPARRRAGSACRTSTCTCRSPRPTLRRCGTPVPRRVSTCPVWVPGRDCRASPRRRACGSATDVPSAAAVIGSCTVQCRSSPSRVNARCSRSCDLDVQVAGRAAAGADLALARTAGSACRPRRPAGIVDGERATARTRPSPPQSGTGRDRSCRCHRRRAGPGRHHLAEERALDDCASHPAAAGRAGLRLRARGAAVAAAGRAQQQRCRR